MKLASPVLIVLTCILASASALSGNINIDGSCPFDSLGGCLQCLSRSSSDIERCQQLYFYITNTNFNNDEEKSRYCSGECPIVRATANYLCRSSTETIIRDLINFDECPDYNVRPSRAIDLNANYSEQNCLVSSSSICEDCIGNNSPDVLRCLQSYLLAMYANTSQQHTMNFCTSNCPLTLSTATWYCNDIGIPVSSAFKTCEQHTTGYCVDIRRSINNSTAYKLGTMNCTLNCSSPQCLDAKQRFGCCLRDSLSDDQCTEILACPIEVPSSSAGISIEEDCPFERSDCMQCLSRSSGDIERCQQLYFYITYSNVGTSEERRRFCSGNCPIVLATANYYCDASSVTYSRIFDECPDYDVGPGSAVTILANYSGQHCLDTFRESRCLECITSNSPEVQQCIQSFLLTQFANKTDRYTKDYCASNCPLTLYTLFWYCGSSMDTFAYCNRNSSGMEGAYCNDLRNSNATDFNYATSNCSINCTNTACMQGKEQFGCCLRADIGDDQCPEILKCTLETAGSRFHNAMSHLIAVFILMALFLM